MIPVLLRAPTRHRPRPVRPFDHGEPLGYPQLVPVAGVLLVAATLMLGAYPLHTHALVLDLPDASPLPQECLLPANPCNLHELAMAPDGALTWDGQPIALPLLRGRLVAGARELSLNLTFTPAPNASYDATLRMLYLIRQELGEDSSICIGGIERARAFGPQTFGSRTFDSVEPDTALVDSCTFVVFTN